MKRKKFKASYTVEASFIMVISILFLMSSICFGYAVYDDVVLRSLSNEVLEESIMYSWDREETKEALEKKVKKELYFEKINSLTVEDKIKKRTLEIERSFRFPILGTQYIPDSIFSNNKLQISITVDSNSELMRKTEALRRAAASWKES